jgi:DNA-binding HxlR family transcriptional regulator
MARWSMQHKVGEKMSIPKPGKPVRGSRSGMPLMALFDLLGKRWAMGVIWQLRAGPATFRGLQGVCESISPAVLNSRLKDLREAKLVCTSGEGYALTDMGAELSRLLEPFGSWALTWAIEVAPEEAARWNDMLSKRLASAGSPGDSCSG